jgi:hypothetical protein
MEKQMLAALQYDLTVPTCFLFNARFRKAAGVQDDQKVCASQVSAALHTLRLRYLLLRA